MRKEKKILVISHNAFWGAGSLLLDECRHLSGCGIQFKFLFLEGGPLLSSFRELGECHILSRVIQPRGIRSAGHFFRDELWLWRIKKIWKPVLIYVNTIVPLCLLKRFSFSSPVICHIHEMATWFKKAIWGTGVVPHQIAQYIAVSKAVKEEIVKWDKESIEKIAVVPASIDTHRIELLKSKIVQFDFSLGPTDLVVGGGGNEFVRKGGDLWLQVAFYIHKLFLNQRVHFVWLGINDPQIEMYKEGIKRMGLEGRIHFLGVQENPYPIYDKFDVFLMTSREDPCPIVMLENMYLGKPIVYFEGCGGTSEVARADAGIPIEPFDVVEMAKQTAALLQDKERSQKMGLVGRQRILDQYTIKHLSEKVLGIIDRVLFKGSGL